MEEIKYMILDENNIAVGMVSCSIPFETLPKNYVIVSDNSKIGCKYENGVWINN